MQNFASFLGVYSIPENNRDEKWLDRIIDYAVRTECIPILEMLQAGEFLNKKMIVCVNMQEDRY